MMVHIDTFNDAGWKLWESCLMLDGVMPGNLDVMLLKSA